MFAVALPSGDAPPADQFRDLAPGCFNRQIGIARIENNGLLQKILARMYYDVSRFCRREPAPQPVELDETTSAEVSFGTASASLAPGTYLGQACLGATGTWKGRECSTPVRLTVLERPQQLTPEQEIAIARRTGRYGLRAGDLQALETAGQRLLAADPGSIPGHMYVGEAKFRQGQWEDALREFTAARTQSKRRHPNLLDNPVALDLRISQILDKLGAGQ